MRVFVATLLAMSLMSSPLWANNANETGKEDTPAAASSASAVPDKPISATLKPEESAIESEMQDLRSLVEEQRAELAEQRAALKVLEEKLGTTSAEPGSAPVSTPTTTPAERVSIVPETPAIGGSKTLASSAATMPQDSGKESPLYFKIGGAEFYPLGFMDLMSTTRTTQLGTIGTSFGSIAFNNTLAGRITETRLSAQNSRIGLRTHAKFGEADVTGYLEADFLGYQPANANDTSNSNTLRMRLYWVDWRRGKIEVFGGQSWSFLTPNRKGLSALPGDLFYSQDVDTNYQLGLTWARQASFRVIAHPNDNWAVGIAFENPQQTLPSSVVVPAAAGTGYVSQFDSNSGNTSSTTGVNNPNTPNLHPDIIPKIAFDANPGGHQVHFDVAGLFRSFRAVNVIQTPASGITSANTVLTTTHGAAVAATANVELVKNLRFIATGFYGDGGGRYIGSTAGPDVIIRPDGTISPVRSGSGIGGFEYQATPSTLIYGYYSGAYFGSNFERTGTTYTGYGYPGSANNNNRYMYEPTIGIHRYLWKNASYGDLRLMTQYSYVSRTPWTVGTGPKTAHLGMVYIDLRYDLP